MIEALKCSSDFPSQVQPRFELQGIVYRNAELQSSQVNEIARSVVVGERETGRVVIGLVLCIEQDDGDIRSDDEKETNLVHLRRTTYLTIMSSVDFEEAGHKLLKIKLEPGQEMELCVMLLECCCQERTCVRYYGLLAQRLCMMSKVHQQNFEKCQQYSMIHRLETNKLRNMANCFAHLLGTYALPWHVLSYIRLTEEDTSSSSRII